MARLQRIVDRVGNRLFNPVQINHLLVEKKRAKPLLFGILAYLCSPN